MGPYRCPDARKRYIFTLFATTTTIVPEENKLKFMYIFRSSRWAYMELAFSVLI